MQRLEARLVQYTALVDHRLYHQEELYAAAMQAIEKEESDMIQLADTRRFGARHLVVMALVAIGQFLLSIGSVMHII